MYRISPARGSFFSLLLVYHNQKHISMQKEKSLYPHGGTIGNALRVALGIFSGKNILNFAFVALCGALQTHFHGRGREGKRHLQRRFLRKRGAAVSGLALSVKPYRACQLSQRESPWHRGKVSGQTAKFAGALAPPWGSCRAATEGLQIGGAGKNG